MATILFYLGVVIFLAGGAGSLIGQPKQLSSLSLMCAGTGVIVISNRLKLNRDSDEDHEEIGPSGRA